MGTTHYKVFDKETKKEYDICISLDNNKMGAIPSISLPRCTTCPQDAPCFRECYMRRLCYRPNVKNTYDRNLEAVEENEEWYWNQVQFFCRGQRFFRYNVCGDIPNIRYFERMVETAKRTPKCDFMAFTKQYEFVNAYLDSGKELPENLSVVFSRWGEYPCDNKHHLPEAWVDGIGEIPKEVKATASHCPGCCYDCNLSETGCWYLGRGEAVIMKNIKH